MKGENQNFETRNSHPLDDKNKRQTEEYQEEQQYEEEYQTLETKKPMRGTTIAIIVAAISIAIILIIVLAVSVLKKPNKQQDLAVKTVEEKVQVEETVEEKESTEEETIQEESTQETKQEFTAKDWIDILNLEQPTIVIWNPITMENTILEEYAEYEMKENDQVLLTTGGVVDSIKCYSVEGVFKLNSMEPVNQDYFILNVEISGIAKTTIETEMAGEIYSTTVTLINLPEETENLEESEISVEEGDLDLESPLDTKEWANSIGTEITKSFVIICNDTEVTKTMVKEGEEYQLKDNDMFFIYIPNDYIIYEFEPAFLSVKTEDTENGIIISLDKSYIRKDTKVNITMKNILDTSKIQEISFILIP